MITSDLFESVGFPNRKQGDEFYNPKDDNDTATFIELIAYPDGTTKFETPELRDQTLKSFSDQVKGNVFVLNKPNAGLLGLYIVHMVDSKGQDDYYVKYVRSTADLAGILTQIPVNIKAPGHGGYRFGSKSARKEAYAIKPSNIFTSEGPYEPAQIPGYVQAAQGMPEDLKAQMVGYLSALVKGNKDFLIQDGDKYRTVHENYTGEFAAPIAIVTAQVNEQAIRQKAEQTLLGGERFANCKVVFPLSATEKLVDSKLVAPNGRTVNVSSKAKSGGGAAASMEGLMDTINLKRDDPDFKPVLEQFGPELRMMETVVKNNAVDGFLQLAREQKLIDQQDEQAIRAGIARAKEGQKSTLEQLTSRLQNYVGNYGADTDNPRYNVVYHATAALSRVLGAKLGEMDVTGAVKAILNYSTFVQIYAGTQKLGNDIKMNSFKMVWPPEYDGTVYIDTAKNFTGTEIRGKISFKFK